MAGIFFDICYLLNEKEKENISNSWLSIVFRSVHCSVCIWILFSVQVIRKRLKRKYPFNMLFMGERKRQRIYQLRIINNRCHMKLAIYSANSILINFHAWNAKFDFESKIIRRFMICKPFALKLFCDGMHKSCGARRSSRR